MIYLNTLRIAFNYSEKFGAKIKFKISIINNNNKPQAQTNNRKSSHKTLQNKTKSSTTNIFEDAFSSLGNYQFIVFGHMHNNNE